MKCKVLIGFMVCVFFPPLFPVFIYYYLKTSLPVHPGIKEPWKYRILMILIQLTSPVASIGVWLKFGSDLDVRRRCLVTLAKFLDAPKREDLKHIVITDLEVNGVSIRLYEPRDNKPLRPAMVYFHGGGFVFMNVDSHDLLTRRLSRHLNMVVISVNYRLAPENPYPAALDDAITVTEYLMKKCKQIRVDPNRVALAGDSAGGNLAAAVSLKMRERTDMPKPKLQILLYPWIQAFDFNTPSFQINSNRPGGFNFLAICWLFYIGIKDLSYVNAMVTNNHTTKEMKASKYASRVSHSLIPRKYYPKEYKLDSSGYVDPKITEKLRPLLTDPYVVPLMADDLSNMPTAYIVTAESDPLRDEGIMYGERLKKAGVSSTLAHYYDGFHSMLTMFDGLLTFDVGKRSYNDLLQFLKEHL